MPHEEDILFAVTALETGFAPRDRVVEALIAAANTEGETAAGILRDSGDLTARQVELIESLAAENKAQSGGDSSKTLQSIGIPADVGKALQTLSPAEVAKTLFEIGPRPENAEIPEDAPGGKDNRYTIKHEHARGGIGRIMVAADNDINREVAMKILIAEGAVSARFVEEAQITGQLEHPNIVPVYEIGRGDDGAPYYTMKLIRGTTLSEKIAGFHASKEGKPLTPLLDTFKDVAQAIAFAHSRGVIHRDLKPENIMIGDFGETVVLDWGLAKVKGREDVRAEKLEDRIRTIRSDSGGGTLDGDILGTPAYMPPEQAEGKIEEVDETSDVYSLGAILYEILTGRPPFEGANPYDILSRVSSDVPEKPSTATPGARVPMELEAICLKAMRKEKGDRYESPTGIITDIESYQEGRSGRAWRYSLVQAVRLWVKKNGAVVAATAVLLIVLACVFAYFTKVQPYLERLRAETAERRRLAAIAGEVGAAADAIAEIASPADYKSRLAKAAGFDAAYLKYLDDPEYDIAFDEYYFTLGEAAAREGLGAEALAHFASTYRAGPTGNRAPDALARMGEEFFKAQEYERARGAFTTILERFPDEPGVPGHILRLGDCFEKLYEFEKAAACYAEVCKRGAGAVVLEKARRGVSFYDLLLPEHDLGLTSSRAYVVDLDGDGAGELVALSPGRLYVLKYSEGDIRLVTEADVTFPQKIKCNMGPGGMAFGDIDGDGRIEIVVPLAEQNMAQGRLWMFTVGDGLALEGFYHEDITSEVQKHATVIADCDNDGENEIVMGVDSLGRDSRVYDYLGGGKFAKTFFMPEATATETSAYSVCVADVNGDGKNEIIVGNGPWGLYDIRVYAYDDTEKRYGLLFEQTTGRTYSLVPRDFDGDGVAEVVCAVGAYDPGLGPFVGGDIVPLDQGLHMLDFENGAFALKPFYTHSYTEPASMGGVTLMKLPGGADLFCLMETRGPVPLITFVPVAERDGTDVRTWRHPLGPSQLESGDIDGDGDDELIAWGPRGLSVFGLAALPRERVAFADIIAARPFAARAPSPDRLSLSTAEDIARLGQAEIAGGLFSKLAERTADAEVRALALLGKGDMLALRADFSAEPARKDGLFRDALLAFESVAGDYPAFKKSALLKSAAAYRALWEWNELYATALELRGNFSLSFEEAALVEKMLANSRLVVAERIKTVFAEDFDAAPDYDIIAGNPLKYRLKRGSAGSYLSARLDCASKSRIAVPISFDGSPLTFEYDLCVPELEWNIETGLNVSWEEYPRRTRTSNRACFWISGLNPVGPSLDHCDAVNPIHEHFGGGEASQLCQFRSIGNHDASALVPSGTWYRLKFEYVPGFKAMRVTLSHRDSGEVIFKNSANFENNWPNSSQVDYFLTTTRLDLNYVDTHATLLIDRIRLYSTSIKVKARRMKPDTPEACADLAGGEFVKGNYARAVELYSKARELGKEDLDTLFYMAAASDYAGNRVAAFGYLLEFFKADPLAFHLFTTRNEMYMEPREVDMLEAFYIYAVPELYDESVSGNTGDEHFRLAALSFVTADYSAAVSGLNAAIDAGGRAECYFLRGIANYARFEAAGAEKDFTYLKEFHPGYRSDIDRYIGAAEKLGGALSSPEAVEEYYARGRYLLERGKDEEAAADFEKVVELAPDSPLGYYYAAACSSALGKKEEAFAYLRAAVEKGIDFTEYDPSDARQFDSIRGSEEFAEITGRGEK